MSQTKENKETPNEQDDYFVADNELTYERTNTSDPVVNMERMKSIQSLNNNIPDKFTGWGLSSVIACFLYNFNTWGSNSAYALYLQKFINDDVFPGTRPIIFGTIGGLTFGTGLMFGPFINYLTGIFGIQQTIFLGALIQFAGLMLGSFSTKIWELVCSEGVLQGIGMALVAIPNAVIIPQWFKGGPGGKRNLAFGIATAGSGIGGIVYNIGLEPIMKKHGWGWSLRTQAIMCFVLNIVATIMIKSRNKDIKPVYKVYDKRIYHCFGTHLMMLWAILSMFGYVTLMYNLGDFTRAMGYNNQHASVVSTMVSVGIVYGRPIVGIIADKIGPIQCSIIASWLVGLFALAWWLPCKNYGTALVFAMFQGSLMGTIWLTSPAIVGSVIGLQKFGVSMGLAWIAIGASGIVSPIIGISLKTEGPTSRLQYQHPAIFVGCCYLAAGLCLCVLRGWLIARNKLAKDVRTEDERLELRVPVKLTIKNIFNLGRSKV